ncbi:FAD-dependent oxidoreductase [Pseudomonas phoenicis]|uniref:NAD(P)/FAD-dependent oxidoreductase n=1 Tax=unclassified Pseudomonas TaxID=196821 RepID=UPI0039A2FB1D
MVRVDALPRDDASPGWFHTSRVRQPKAPLLGDAQAPWVVVGGGFTGLAAARQLALNFPQDRVILVEAQQVGFGTSGRNAGFLIDVPHDIGAPDYIGDKANAKNILHLNQRGQGILRDLVEQHNIVDAHLRHSGKYQAAIEDKGIAVLNAYRGGLEALGEKVELIEGNELKDHIGTSFYRKALYTPGTMLVQPSALVKGLADSLPENVSLYEDTVITTVDYGQKIVLHHPTGRITADKLGTGAGCRALVPRRRPTRLARTLARGRQRGIRAACGRGAVQHRRHAVRAERLSGGRRHRPYFDQGRGLGTGHPHPPHRAPRRVRKPAHRAFAAVLSGGGIPGPAWTESGVRHATARRPAGACVVRAGVSAGGA